ncbi:MAG TPA: pantothenate kinase [Cytophagales bacterium]|nr:pantothenate kinase [Cytophagales bacterium]
MNLAVDYGNSRIKAGLFENHHLVEHVQFESDPQFEAWLGAHRFEHVIISSVTRDTDHILQVIKCDGAKLVMSQSILLPLTIKYATPLTLGVDRIAAACGAIEIMPNRDCLVIDMGTCINYEFVDDQLNYHGGAISPGVKMRFDAMHTFTARLPLIHLNDKVALTGNSTETCMQSGVMNGVLSELEGIIALYREKYPSMGVILCGGDAHIFENKLKQPIFVAPNLVLRGLNSIMLHNVNF